MDWLSPCFILYFGLYFSLVLFFCSHSFLLLTVVVSNRFPYTTCFHFLLFEVALGQNISPYHFHVDHPICLTWFRFLLLKNALIRSQISTCCLSTGAQLCTYTHSSIEFNYLLIHSHRPATSIHEKLLELSKIQRLKFYAMLHRTSCDFTQETTKLHLALAHLFVMIDVCLVHAY